VSTLRLAQRALSGERGISLIGGALKSSGNSVDNVRLQENAVNGVVDDASVISDAPDGSNGNLVSIAP
jgi:hypothetical protein